MQQASRVELWGEGPQRMYWWHLRVRPDKRASLGRDMVVALFVWVVAIVAVLMAIDLSLVAR